MRIKYSFIFVLLVFINIPADAQLRNLVRNGSFEFMDRDTVRESPDESWTFTTDFENVTGHVTESRSLDRFRSYLIRAEEGRGKLESDPFNVDRRKDYLLSFGACGGGAIQTEILWWREEDDSLTLIGNDNLDVSAVTDDWGIFQFDLTSPRRASAASVRFTVFDGYVWIDDVRFRNLIFNRR